MPHKISVQYGARHHNKLHLYQQSQLAPPIYLAGSTIECSQFWIKGKICVIRTLFLDPKIINKNDFFKRNEHIDCSFCDSCLDISLDTLLEAERSSYRVHVTIFRIFSMWHSASFACHRPFNSNFRFNIQHSNYFICVFEINPYITVRNSASSKRWLFTSVAWSFCSKTSPQRFWPVHLFSDRSICLGWPLVQNPFFHPFLCTVLCFTSLSQPAFVIAPSLTYSLHCFALTADFLHQSYTTFFILFIARCAHALKYRSPSIALLQLRSPTTDAKCYLPATNRCCRLVVFDLIKIAAYRHFLYLLSRQRLLLSWFLPDFNALHAVPRGSTFQFIVVIEDLSARRL